MMMEKIDEVPEGFVKLKYHGKLDRGGTRSFDRPIPKVSLRGNGESPLMVGRDRMCLATEDEAEYLLKTCHPAFTLVGEGRQESGVDHALVAQELARMEAERIVHQRQLNENCIVAAEQNDALEAAKKSKEADRIAALKFQIAEDNAKLDAEIDAEMKAEKEAKGEKVKS